MAKPVASPSQVAAIQSTVTDQTAQQSAMTETAGLQDAVIAKAALVDQAFKDLFDWYNGAIIAKYDAEKKAINGIFVTTPVVEADILNVAANPPSGRLIPSPPTTNIVRIAEFDGGGTSSTLLNELQHITDQASIESGLSTGFSPQPTLNLTSQTASSLTGVSTTLDVTDTASMTFTIGDYFVVKSITDSAVVKVTSVTPTGTPPPYTFTLGIQVIVPPTGTLVSASDLITFSGFTNGERTTKTASLAYLQNVMDGLIVQLTAHLNARKARIVEQVAALGANEDPDAVAAISAATTAANNASAFITSYLISTDISNTGLGSLSSERGSRTTQLNSRVTAINTAYTGQTENYYNQRYDTANNRGNTQRGTLRAKSNAQGVKDNMLALASSLTGSINALNSILP
jgi:hypothetical protein